MKKITLVITGDDDLLVSSQNARYLAGIIPNAQLVLYENGGHGLMFQYPDKFSGKMIDFLR
jgi:pimeloyl-ACP methyl ester carboxylesterase